MDGEAKNLTTVVSIVVACTCYCYFVSSRIPKGKYRLISLLPIFYIFAIVPRALSYVLSTFITTLCITWIAIFKLLLFAFDKGPLFPLKSLPLFIAIAAFPIKIKQQKDASTKPIRRYFNYVVHVFLFGMTARVMHEYKQDLSPIYRCGLIAVILFLSYEVFFGLFHLITQALFNVEVEPVSDDPFLAISMRDFWGRRWNCMVSDALRQTIYNPVKSASEPYLGKKLAPHLAVMVTFFVSGLWHEVLYCHVTRLDPTWEATFSFVVYGVLRVIESLVKRQFGGKYELPLFISRPLTVGFLSVPFYLWIYIPLARNGIDVRLVEELMPVMNSTKTKMPKWAYYY